MKYLDGKSVLIGMLVTVIAIMLIGQADRNIGDITVKSISVIDENGITKIFGNAIVLQEIKNGMKTGLSTYIYPNGITGYFNDVGEILSFDIGYDNAGDGRMRTFNEEGLQTSYLGSENFNGEKDRVK